VEAMGGKIYQLNQPFCPEKGRFFLHGALNAFFEAHSYDVVHVHSGSGSMLGLISYCAKKYGTPKVIVHSHTIDIRRGLKKRALQMVLGGILQKYANIYCACSYEAARTKYSKKMLKQTHVIKNGIAVDKFTYNEEVRNKIRKELSIKEDTFVVGHVGRFSYEKNHEFLIDVFREFHKSNENSILLLLGEGEKQGKIKRKAEAYGLSEAVRFLGAVDNVNVYYQAMDCFVLPSTVEGLPIVSIEAQAAGLPCVVSEAVPPEAKITDLFTYASLGDIGAWCGKIKDAMNCQRRDMHQGIVAAGYDIRCTADVVRRLYLEK